MRHIISILLQNEIGALARVAGLFSARGYNIESSVVAPTDDDKYSRMTVVTQGSAEVVDQIIKQTNKLIDVVNVAEITKAPHIEREMLLIKLDISNTGRREAMDLIEIFRGHIIDVTETSFVIELTGSSSKLDAFINACQNDIIELVRTGVNGIARGATGLVDTV